MSIEFNMFQTTGFACILLIVGNLLRNRIKFLENFAIPPAVIGGFLFSFINLLLRNNNILIINFDTGLQDLFMYLFFVSVGYGASVLFLKKAGSKVFKFLILATILVFLQNLIALILSNFVGVDRSLALMTGSTAMTGGHGTAAAIAPMLEKAGFPKTETVAFSAATFGLVAGSLMGGPMAAKLIERRRLMDKRVKYPGHKPSSIIEYGDFKLDQELILRGFFAIFIAIFLGSYLTDFLNSLLAKLSDIAKLPGYIGPMIVAVILRALNDKFENKKDREGFLDLKEIEVIGSVGLNIFLGMALMGLKLWELAELALPLVILLLAQSILMFAYARFITFNFMGKDYDAAILAAGHTGFGMGATPNGVANMESVCEEYEYSETAFFVLPVVGGMFIDFINILIIIPFISFL